MRLIRGLHNLTPFENGCVATIGNFDGVHLGHQKILEQVRTVAKMKQVPSVVMVFEPQPREYFSHGEIPPRLMRFREKLAHLGQQGIDIVLCLQFNARLRNLSAEQFIDGILRDHLKLKHLVVGDDFRFGCDRRGNYAMLEQYGQQYGFSVERTHTVLVGDERVSSTRIREVLDCHDFKRAEALLGHFYTITGVVVHGQKLGRQIGVPTANIALGRKVPALNGVFAVSVRVVPKGDYHAAVAESWQGVANIGLRPTVNGKAPSLEVHLFDFSGDVYGAHLQVAFRSWLRGEQKFDGVEALKAQIQRDIAKAKSFFNQTVFEEGEPKPERANEDAQQ